MTTKNAIIIGCGPAGLTAAYELLAKTDLKPIIFEMSHHIGGISKTINYKNNRMDMGGHRFFSKSDTVMQWWLNIMPLQASPARDEPVTTSEQGRPRPEPDPETTDRVMLLRRRLSRIFYLRCFFDYPISLSKTTLANLGVTRVVRIGTSYLYRMLVPLRVERSLEDFLVNRFGDELYKLFFRDYTEKVWGVKPSQIKPDWGAQRIKGLSISKVILHALSRIVRPARETEIAQKDVETSLIERFYYPKLGPGQLWEEVADRIRERGGEIHMGQRIVGIDINNGRVAAVTVRDEATGQTRQVSGEWIFSTMPVRELIGAMGDAVPQPVREVASGLVYRDFITVGLLLKRLRISDGGRAAAPHGTIPDLWVYIQERDVKVGRLQVFNNWSPYLVADASNVWVGLEYFCSEGDGLDRLSETEMAALAIEELARLGMAEPGDVLDSVVVKVPKAYPAYFGSYDHFDKIRAYTDSIENLFLIGRNGQHRYNNMDHSMLTAMAAVDAVSRGHTGKEAVWAVNTEQDYHEHKKG